MSEARPAVLPPLHHRHRSSSATLPQRRQDPPASAPSLAPPRCRRSSAPHFSSSSSSCFSPRPPRPGPNSASPPTPSPLAPPPPTPCPSPPPPTINEQSEELAACGGGRGSDGKVGTAMGGLCTYLHTAPKVFDKMHSQDWRPQPWVKAKANLNKLMGGILRPAL